MARYHSFRVYQLAMELVKETQKDIQHLKGEADLRDQMRRASRSIVANICEGSERGTDKELKQFLIIARASAAELHAWYEMAQALGYINKQRSMIIMDIIDHTGRSLSSFINKISH